MIILFYFIYVYFIVVLEIVLLGRASYPQTFGPSAEISQVLGL